MDIPTTMTEFPKGQEALQEVITNMIIEIFAYLAERERGKTSVIVSGRGSTRPGRQECILGAIRSNGQRTRGSGVLALEAS